MAAILILVTAACRLVNDSEDAGAPGEAVSLAAWRADSGLAGHELRGLADEVYQSIAGTEQQRNALIVLKTYRGNLPMDTCLAEAGFPEWDWSLNRTYADPIDPLSVSTWFESPFSRWRSHDLVAFRPFLFAERRMNATPPREFEGALDRCMHATPDDRGPAYVDPGRRAAGLTKEWHQLVRSLDAAHGPPEERYWGCMDDADVDVLDRQGWSISEVGEAMSGASPDDSAIPADPTDPAQWAHPDWQRFLLDEQQFFEADWACRQDVYTDNVDAIQQAIVEFAEVHAGELKASKTYWSDVQALAAQMGYHGQTGSLEGVVTG